MGGGCGPNCTTFTINVPLSTLTDDKRESIRESIIALLQGLEAGKVTVSFREGSTKAYASTKNPVNEETLNGKVTEAGDIQTLGDSKFIIAQINGKATEYNNKLIIVKTDNEIEYIDDVGNPEVVAQTDWTSKGITGDQIKHVAFGKDVKTIADFAFGFCTSLTEVTIPDSVKTIGDEAFARCTSLTEVTIPVSVQSIGYIAFADCTSLTEIIVDAGNTNYSSDINGVLFNKYKTDLIQYPVGNTSNTYTLPDSVETIGDSAFLGCTSLGSVDLPAGVTTIGKLAFECCTSLGSVDLPAGVTTIGRWAFQGCSSLASVIIPEGVTTIEPKTFSGCIKLGSIELPAGVTTIGRGAFEVCTSLASITLPAGVTTIGDWAFKGCTSLGSIDLPAGVTTIGVEAFNGCTSLSSVTIPKSVTSFGLGQNGLIFKNCVKLETVTFEGERDEDVKLTFSMFVGCEKLAAIDLPEKVLFDVVGLKTATSIFEGCTSLGKVTVRDSRVLEYLDGAFNGVPAVQADTLDFNVANELDGGLSFGADNGAFSDLSGDGLTFGDPDSGGAGVKTVEVV